MVNPMVCAGYGVCVGTASEIFDLTPDGHGFAKVLEVPEELQHVVRAAARQCPTGAILVKED
jgi:ferredoxin